MPDCLNCGIPLTRSVSHAQHDRFGQHAPAQHAPDAVSSQSIPRSYHPPHPVAIHVDSAVARDALASGAPRKERAEPCIGSRRGGASKPGIVSVMDGARGTCACLLLCSETPTTNVVDADTLAATVITSRPLLAVQCPNPSTKRCLSWPRSCTAPVGVSEPVSPVMVMVVLGTRSVLGWSVIVSSLLWHGVHVASVSWRFTK
mmetsp:Transcript_55074/g.112577  ORF Transcript_55074/g.112577 Transcript_55074/m.112577 type:complete len:202 (+) Transcript_55074:568-1173(+)